MLRAPEKHWACPNCRYQHVTREARPHTPMHPCAGLAGFLSPLLPAGSTSRVYAVEREDYVGTDDVRRDENGRPVMAVITQHADGSNDTHVYAPTAHAVMST